MIAYLTPGDFFITQTGELSHRHNSGFCVIFFSSHTCVYCKDVYPAFVAVSDAIKGCTFAIMNVDQEDMKVVRMSHKTKNALEVVPWIVMYANGNIVATFSPDESDTGANFNLLKDFIINTAAMVRSGQPVSGEKRHGETYNSEFEEKICDTSTGIAICGPKSKRVCYLVESEAYKKE
jgi:hypothetical protein